MTHAIHAKPIQLGAFLRLLTPFEYYLLCPDEQYNGQPTYELVELALENIEDDVFGKLVYVRWSEDGKIATITKVVPARCYASEADNDQAALVIKHRSAVPARPAPKPQFKLMK